MAHEYKKGDEIIFLRDIRAGSERTGAFNGEIRIPKNTVCTIRAINDSHIWVQYNDRDFRLRNIKERMAPAGKASILLYGDKE